MQLFVWNADVTEKVPVVVAPATQGDLSATDRWQTSWTSDAAAAMPNKVALHRVDDGELLGLMSYEVDAVGLAVEVIYLESAFHSNANLLRQKGGKKKYVGVAKALFAYAVTVSMEEGFGGVVYFKAKTSELREYYIRQFGARPLGSYDPFRLILWEDRAEALLREYGEEAER